MGFFLWSLGGTSYFPLGPPLRGKVALRAIFFARFLMRTFSVPRILLFQLSSLPITGGSLSSGLDCAHTLVWAFFVVPCGTSYFEAWWAVYYVYYITMPLILTEGVARKFLSYNRLVDFRVNVLQTLKSTNYLIINLLRITQCVP